MVNRRASGKPRWWNRIWARIVKVSPAFGVGSLRAITPRRGFCSVLVHFLIILAAYYLTLYSVKLLSSIVSAQIYIFIASFGHFVKSWKEMLLVFQFWWQKFIDSIFALRTINSQLSKQLVKSDFYWAQSPSLWYAAAECHHSFNESLVCQVLPLDFIFLHGVIWSVNLETVVLQSVVAFKQYSW